MWRVVKIIVVVFVLLVIFFLYHFMQALPTRDSRGSAYHHDADQTDSAIGQFTSVRQSLGSGNCPGFYCIGLARRPAGPNAIGLYPLLNRRVRFRQ